MAANPTVESQTTNWQTIALFSLGFWLSGCLLLDVVIMPSMYAAGMMTQPDFASAGYTIFGIFNRIELLCAALVLTGLLTLVKLHKVNGKWTIPAIILSILLLAVALIDTYGLTPQMSALGMQLNWFDPVAEVPAAMNQMHEGYWALEVLKLVGGGILLSWFYRNQREVVAE